MKLFSVILLLSVVPVGKLYTQANEYVLELVVSAFTYELLYLVTIDIMTLGFTVVVADLELYEFAKRRLLKKHIS